MTAIVASVYFSHWKLSHSIYTLKLHRRGIHYPYEPEPATIPPRPAAAAAPATAADPSG
jgi:hypothetical protein